MDYAEDAGCAYPCGGEPLNCPTCSDRGTRASSMPKCLRCGVFLDETAVHGFCVDCADHIAFGEEE